MNSDCLTSELTNFLRSSTARAQCRRYGVLPEETLGSLYICLLNQARSAAQIRNLGAWVRTNAAYHLKNYLRSEHGHARNAYNAISNCGFELEMADDTLDPPSILDRQEQHQAFGAELSKLPDHERDAFLAWATFSGESCRKAAQRYQVSPQTVCNWAKHAGDQLRQALGEYA